VHAAVGASGARVTAARRAILGLKAAYLGSSAPHNSPGRAGQRIAQTDEVKNAHMRRKRHVFMLGIALLAGALAMAGCASAATKTRTTAPGGTSATATGRATAATAGKTHITVYSLNSDGPDFRVILTGAVGDYVPGLTIYPSGKIDPRHTSEMELKLTHVSFRLSIASLGKKIVAAFRHFLRNASTCSGTVTAAAAAPIVAGSGTGSYQGIGGGFSMTATIDEVDARPVCNGTGKFLSQFILMVGSGTISP
jgi:hypothetical protein